MGLDIKKYLLALLDRSKPDDHARAAIAWAKCSSEEMNSVYGESGKTRLAILNEYADDLLRWQAIRQWVAAFIPDRPRGGLTEDEIMAAHKKEFAKSRRNQCLREISIAAAQAGARGCDEAESLYQEFHQRGWLEWEVTP